MARIYGTNNCVIVVLVDSRVGFSADLALTVAATTLSCCNALCNARSHGTTPLAEQNKATICPRPRSFPPGAVFLSTRLTMIHKLGRA